MPEPEPQVEPVHLPQPTIWPAVMAMGITMFASGFVLGYLLSAGGLALFAWSVYGWITDLMSEAEPEAADEGAAVISVGERDRRG